ncbi:hypothetical protein MJC1_02755 [Methylocystis sp. MJC1]|nr:hypothetical protein MJC1_02755 [Methylocystis sp. MJC1]
MDALRQLIAAHPFACAWVASAFLIWFTIYTRTGGFGRRQDPRHHV